MHRAYFWSRVLVAILVEFCLPQTPAAAGVCRGEERNLIVDLPLNAYPFYSINLKPQNAPAGGVYQFKSNGGVTGIQTLDLRLAKAAL